MVGPTGTGKTAVAAMAAEALSGTIPVSLRRVSAPSYMPAGAANRGTRETICVIGEHIARHERTLLFIDEIDKIQESENAWMGYIRAELFDLLDGRWPAGLKEIEDENGNEVPIESLTKKLQNSVFCLAAGTFQSWFDDTSSRRTMGFAAEIAPETHELSADIIAEKLPRELANRLNSSLIRIQELTPDDYHRIARETVDKLPQRMQQAFRAEVARRIPGAIATKKGVRFLEEVMLSVLINLPPSPEIIAEIVKSHPEIPTLDLCTL